MCTYLLLVYLQIITCETQFINDEDSNSLFPDWEIFYIPMGVTPNTKYYAIINSCTCGIYPGLKITCHDLECEKFPAELNVTEPTFKLHITSIKTIFKDDLKNYSNLAAFEIEANPMFSKIEVGSFRNMNKLENLTIVANSQLTYLEENVFEGLVNLRILCISRNGFMSISQVTRACSAMILPKIKVLFFAEYSFSEVHKDDFYAMNGSSVEQLSLNFCQIRSIHPDCLKPLKNLNILRLEENLIDEINLINFLKRTQELGIQLKILNISDMRIRHNSVYELLKVLGNSTIIQLELSGNDFAIINDNWFPQMLNLTKIDLRFCQITEITEKAFLPLENLQYLLLKGNKLTSIPQAVTVLKHLQFLDISANIQDEQFMNIFDVPKGIFPLIKNLMRLQISYNNIKIITKSTFFGLENIIKLMLKNASLSYIQSGSFGKMKKLLYLDLSNNYLLGLLPFTPDTFLGLNNLHKLLLAGCSLVNLTTSPNILTYLSNLTYLNLENNILRTIYPNQLTHLTNLKELHLSNNKLPSWDKRILPSNLSILNVSKNKFSNITVAMLEDWQSVENLNTQDNPIFCDCSLSQAAIWIKENKMSINKNKLWDPNNYIAQCFGPQIWTGKSVIEFFNYLDGGECKGVFHLTTIIFGSILLILLLISIFLGYFYRWHIRYWLFLWRLSFLRHYPKKSLIPCEREYEYDVFVSYSSEDSTFVSNLVSILEPSLRLCIFERDFPLGSDISKSVLQTIFASRRTLLIISEAFAKSSWCRWETQLAQCHQLFFKADSTVGPDDTLLLVRLQPVKKHATPILRYLMKTRIYLDWPQDKNKQEEFWDKLKVALESPKGEARRLESGQGHAIYSTHSDMSLSTTISEYL